MSYLLLNRDGINVNWTHDAPPLTIVGDDVYQLDREYEFVEPVEGEELGTWVGSTTITHIGTTDTLLGSDDWTILATCGRPASEVYTESGAHVFESSDSPRGFLSNRDSLIVRGGVSSDGNPINDEDGKNEAWIVQVDGNTRVGSRFVTYPGGTVTHRLLDGEERLEFRWANDEFVDGDGDGGIFVADPYTGIKIADEPDIDDRPEGQSSPRTVGWPGYVHNFDSDIPDPPVSPSTTVFLIEPSSNPPALTSYNGGPSHPATGKINMYFSNVVSPDDLPYAVPPDFWDPSVVQRPVWAYSAGVGATAEPIVAVHLWMAFGGSSIRLDSSDFSIFYREEGVGGGPTVDAGIYDGVYSDNPIFIGDDPEPQSYFFVVVYGASSATIPIEVDYDLFSFWISGGYIHVPPNPPLGPYRFISANESIAPEDTDGIGNVVVLGDDRFIGGAGGLEAQRDHLLPLGYWTSSAARNSSNPDGADAVIYTMMLHFEEAEPDALPSTITGFLDFSRARFVRSQPS